MLSLLPIPFVGNGSNFTPSKEATGFVLFARPLTCILSVRRKDCPYLNGKATQRPLRPRDAWGNHNEISESVFFVSLKNNRCQKPPEKSKFMPGKKTACRSPVAILMAGAGMGVKLFLTFILLGFSLYAHGRNTAGPEGTLKTRNFFLIHHTAKRVRLTRGRVSCTCTLFCYTLLLFIRCDTGKTVPTG